VNLPEVQTHFEVIFAEHFMQFLTIEMAVHA